MHHWLIYEIFAWVHGYNIKTYFLTAARFLHISAVIFFQYVGVLIYRRIQVTGKFWDLKWIDVDQAFLRGKSTYLRKKKKKENKINNKLLL